MPDTATYTMRCGTSGSVRTGPQVPGTPAGTAPMDAPPAHWNDAADVGQLKPAHASAVKVLPRPHVEMVMGWPSGTSGPRSIAKMALGPSGNVALPQVTPDHSSGDVTVMDTLRDALKTPVSVAAMGSRLPQTGLDVGVGVDVGDAVIEAVALVVGDGVPPCVSVDVMDAVADEEGVMDDDSDGSTVKSTDAVGVAVDDADAVSEPVDVGVAPVDSDAVAVELGVTVDVGVMVGCVYVTRTLKEPDAEKPAAST